MIPFTQPPAPAELPPDDATAAACPECEAPLTITGCDHVVGCPELDRL